MKGKKFYFIGWVIFVSILLILQPFTIDDVYNYSFGQNIKNGLIPYLDYNMIVTPLSAYITAFCTLIFDNIFVIKFLWIITTVIVCILINEILSKFINDIKLNYILSIMLAFFTGIFSMYSYNLLALCLILYSCNYILSVKDLTYKNFLVLSFVVFVTILLKQTTGVVLLITNLFYLIILAIKQKTSTSKIFLNILLYLGNIFMLLFFFIILLGLNGSLENFVEQTLFGISNFNKEDIIVSFTCLSILISFVFIAFIYTYFYKKNLTFKLFVLMGFGISQSAIFYPLPNRAHLIVGVTIALILAIIMLKQILNKYFGTCIYFIFFVMHLLCALAILLDFTEKEYIISQQKYFYGNIIEKEIEDNVNLLNDYIESNEGTYYIITENSMMFNMNRDIYYKYYDLFFDGNLGQQNPMELIKKIENDYIVIYTDSTKDFWQIPKEVLEYIRKLQKVDEVGPYSIYTK